MTSGIWLEPEAQAFAEAAANGLVVEELAPGTLAAAEISALMLEIQEKRV